MDDPVYLNGPPWTAKEWVGFGAIIAAVLGLTIALAACTSKSDAAKAAAKVDVQQTQQAPGAEGRETASAATPAPASDEPAPSDVQAMDAMVRGHPHATKICIDAERDGYLIHWPDTGSDDKVFTGWHFIEKKNIQFYFMKQNNTFFIGDIEADKYPQVYPDVTGLPCKDM